MYAQPGGVPGAAMMMPNLGMIVQNAFGSAPQSDVARCGFYAVLQPGFVSQPHEHCPKFASMTWICVCCCAVLLR